MRSSLATLVSLCTPPFLLIQFQGPRIAGKISSATIQWYTLFVVVVHSISFKLKYKDDYVQTLASEDSPPGIVQTQPNDLCSYCLRKIFCTS